MTEHEAFDFLDEYYHLSLSQMREKLGCKSYVVLVLWDAVKPYISAWEEQRNRTQRN